MRIVKASKKGYRPSNRPMTRKPVRAEEEIDIDVDEEIPAEDAEATVDPAATDMLFEAEDVAELVAQVTGEDVTVEVDDEEDSVIFTVGEEEYTVTPEGDEEILEASRKALKGKKPVKASTNRPARRRNAPAARKPMRRR